MRKALAASPYDSPFHLKTPAVGLEIPLGYWAGTVAAVRHLGRELGVIMHPPYHLQVDQRFEAGDHQLEIDIIGNMRNMMGPHLADGLAGSWTWARCPVVMPAGKEYRFVTTGLSAPPRILALR